MGFNIPPLPILVGDALALGYRVVVLVVDDEKDNQFWCANTAQYLRSNIDLNHGHNLDYIKFLENEMRLEELENIISTSPSAWKDAIEKVHGGPISSIEEIEAEELLESESEIHDTWFDPAKPDDVVEPDSACYCGWLGIDPPPAEWAPPGCSCKPQEGDEI